MVNLATQMKEAAAGGARQGQEGSRREVFQRCGGNGKSRSSRPDEARLVAQAAKLSDAPLRALADNSKPVPLPENAEEVKFEGADGRLDFYSASTVRAVVAFYRDALKAQGWKERPSIINSPRMVVMEFSKGGKAMSFTVMQMGPKVKIMASGSALVMADAKMAAKPGAAGVQAANEPAAKTTDRPLEADPDSALPLPKEHSMTSMGTGKMPGSDAPFRRDLEASIPAELGSVLAFYRSELGKRGWKEQAEGAVVKPDQVRLAFASSDGPATLKLGRRNGETSVNLAQKYPAAAAKAEIIPKPGQAKLVFGNMGDGEATVTINKQTIKVAGGAGGPQSPSRPMLELPPGKYQYSVKLAGRPAKSDSVEVTANDAWGFMIAPSGEALSLQIY